MEVIIAEHYLEAYAIDLHTNAEIVAASFNCKHLQKAIIVGSIYIPTDKSLYHSQELCTPVNDLHTRFRDHIFRTGGDANLHAS